MILTKYLSKEVLKSQIAILLILLLIFFSQQLVRILGSATNGKVPTDLVFSLLGLGIPTMIQLILPLSLFIALLLTFGRLYAESEITVMRACGIGQQALVKVALLLAFFTAIFATYNTFYLSPLSLKQQEDILDEAKANPTMSLLSAGQFVTLNGTVLFIDDIKKDVLKDVYIFQSANKNNLPAISVAEFGSLKSLENGDQILALHNTARTEGVAGKGNFTLTHFDNYEAYLGHKAVTNQNSTDEEMLTLPELLTKHSQEAKAELHWRFTLIFSVPIMALIAVALSKVNPRQGRFAKILPALLIYLIYFLLQSSLKSAGASGKLNAEFFIPAVNFAFLALGIFLNSWNSPRVYQWRTNLKSKSLSKKGANL